MPELLHTFTKGKMNKDLDERLVPNGEYRDALNLEVATSEGSDVGTLQTLLGNAERVNRTFDPNTNLHTTWQSYGIEKYIPADAKAIGKIKDATTEKIYWLIAAEGLSAIVEYDQTIDVVFPILVDVNGILNFSEDYLVTGINIIEGFLLWTDNQTEPKKIEISKFKEGSVDFVTHTQVHGIDFTEQYVTVIKKSPLSSPTIYKKDTVRDGEISTITSYEFNVPDPDDTGEVVSLDFGTQVTLNWNNPVAYIAGDFLLLTISDPDDNFDREFQVRVKVAQVISELSALCEIQNIGEDAPTGVQTWEVELEQDDPLFEFKFPRFAFRYKYDDNQFSTFSPFTEVAFIPGKEFEYTGADGYNLAMTNNIRVLEIRDFITPDIPKDVVAVDILYKESNSQNIYRVDTIEKNAPNLKDKAYNQWNDTSYQDTPTGKSGRIKIETELISSLLPSNQILRSYDNVPLRALAQEITGNRLIYGNYVQNFNMVDFANNEVIPAFNFSIVHDPTKNEDIVLGENLQSDPIAGVPIPSLKTMRTYQMGVVYKDAYGRTTPVFTNDSGGRSLSKEFADLYNTIEIGLTNNPPKWATSYQFYIKETSNEYYNIALDRFYLPEDGSVWLSFPSADRNKVDEETFLELKKQHDAPVFIPESARYKILAISNEAPDAVKTVRKNLGRQSTSFTAGGYPRVDQGFFEIPEADFDGTEDGSEGGGGLKGLNTKNNLYCRIISGTDISSYFEINFIQKQGPVYRVELKRPTDESLAFAANSIFPTKLDIAIYQDQIEQKPEYEGRFFVKIYKDLALEENILKKAADDQLSIEYKAELARLQVSGNSGFWRNTSPDVSKGWFWDLSSPLNVRPRAGSDVKYEGGNQANVPNTGLGIVAGERQVTISYHGFGPEEKKAFYQRLGIWWGWPLNNPSEAHYIGFAKSLSTPGAVFRISEDPNKELDSNTYTIKRTYKSAYCVANRRTGRHGSGKYASRRVIRWNITVNKPIQQSSVNNVAAINNGTANPEKKFIEFVKLYEADADTYSSTDPAIFETYPKEAVDLDLYYSASNIFPINNPGTINASHQPLQKLSWFNCYTFGNGVESDRIRDDFNATRLDKGPIVSTVLDEAYGEELKATGLIFSQIFNSRSGINRLNQFIQAEAITKDLNPYYTSIQKLYSRDTNLITLCEDKCLQILANKDALFNADGSTNVVSNNAVLGQALPYAGEYGISKNPESFAAYGNRAYFTDKNRGVVLRLSGGLGGGQGLTEISAANMRDFFSDNLHSSSRLIGSYDDDKDVYNLTIPTLTSYWQDKLGTEGTTLSFKEDVKGWTSRKSFVPEGALSLNNKYYSFKGGKIWEHGLDTATRNNFYGVQYDSSIRFLMNAQPNVVKKYKTLNYSGSDSKTYLYGTNGPTSERLYSLAELKSNTSLVPNYEQETDGWYCSFIETNLQKGSIKQFVDKEGKFFNYIKGQNTEFNTNTDNNLDAKEFTMQGIGRAEISGDTQAFFNLHFYINPECHVP